MGQAARKRRKKAVFVMVVNGTRCKTKKKGCVCAGGEWDKLQEKEEKGDCVCDGGEWDKMQEKQEKMSLWL